MVRVGVNQGVALPGHGDYLVTFSYLPDSVPVGLALSAVAGLGLLIWAARRGRAQEAPVGAGAGRAGCSRAAGPDQPGVRSPTASAARR